MEILSQEKRDQFAERVTVEKPLCICGGREAIGSWGIRVGHAPPFGYTPPMSYCREHLSDLIDGLELVVRDLKQVRNKLNLRVER